MTDRAVAWEILARSPYVLLTTFRKTGVAVATPVWIVPSGDRLLVWTHPTAGKVKRIRRDGHVTLAPCRVRGEAIGRSIAAVATVPPTGVVPGKAELREVYRALIAKYGLIARLTLLPNQFLALVGRPRPAGIIEIRLPE